MPLEVDALFRLVSGCECFSLVILRVGCVCVLAEFGLTGRWCRWVSLTRDAVISRCR